MASAALNSGCQFTIKQGARKGEACGRDQAVNSLYCHAHNATMAKDKFSALVKLEANAKVQYKNAFSFVGPASTAKVLIEQYLKDLLDNIDPSCTVDFNTNVLVTK
jgi:hypothetical protein